MPDHVTYDTEDGRFTIRINTDGAQVAHRGAPFTELKVDLDKIDVEKEQGSATGVRLIRLDFIEGGRRVYVHIDLFKHALKQDVTLRMTKVGPGRDVSRTMQIKPWFLTEED